MEASNTEDKNVQTRSPNKTMNTNPKKEMQPWLLTKSVPQTSSSLAAPKSGETTTDSGNIVIVSDWLVERKTTEDFNTKQTEDPDVSTNQEFTMTTTTQPLKPTQNFQKESNLEKNIQTVKPTPVDEVVFTRIDIPNRIQEEVHDSPTTTASTQVENNTSSALNLPNTVTDLIILSENSTPNLPLNSSYRYSEEKSAAHKIDKESSSSNKLYKEPENESLSTVSSIDLGENLLTQTYTITKKAPIKVKPAKDDVIETSPPEHLEVEITKNRLNPQENKESQQMNESTQNETVKSDSLTESFEQSEGPTNLPQGVTVSDDKDRSPGEMTLEHLFGLEESKEGESTKQIFTSTEKYNAGNSIPLQDEKKNTIYTTLSPKIDKIFTLEGSEEGSLKNKPTTDIVKLEEINNAANNGLTKGDKSSHLYELLTSTGSYREEETTTYFTTELNINKMPLQSGEFVDESNEKNEETTYLPETTPEFETSTLLVVTTPKQLKDGAKENVLENLIEGKQEDKTNYKTNIDTTTPSDTENSRYTDQVTTESSKSSTTQGFPLNTTSMLNKGNYKNNIQEASSHSYISEVNAFIDSTSTPDYKETTENTLSEIEIILGGTNNTNVIEKSIGSQESNEQDEVILNFAFDEISSENKEVIHVNHPPVLELNSHVPFLQIGGDGNSESSDTEYYQTTVVNSLDAVDDFNKKAIQGNKEIIKLMQNEDTSNSSVTVIPSTTVEALSSTKKPSNENVEEFTIPTIAVVPLTPGDLKMIAEYLISEKIKPASSSKNNSMLSPNQWLKGNLTSEENIASILSAANVSIGLMNNTNIGRKLDTFNKGNQSVRIEKFEKETRYKSNSLLGNKNVVTSKTDYLHDKNSDNQEIPKTTIHPQEETDSGTITSEQFSTEATRNGLQMTPMKKINNRSQQDFENFPKLKTEGTSTDIISKVGIQENKADTLLKSTDDFSKTTTAGSNRTVHKVINKQTTKPINGNKQNETTTVDRNNKDIENGNVPKTNNLKSQTKINQETTHNISRLSISDEKSSDSSTTNKIETSTSKNVMNKSLQEGISS